ncbi:hypothetical protein DL98DRAFT_525155 [Cadophora sp. DSE1049]|nr:hypothetical protein DL98DRAFT_525155 [Cadophora sp. DSE1049]
MKLALTLPTITSILLTTTLTSLTTALCYTTGKSLNRERAGYHVGRACKGYDGNAGALQGYFAPGATKYACINDAVIGGGKLELEVQNLNSGIGFDLGDVDCTAELNLIIGLCGMGGTVPNSEGWRFRVDPNAGSC